MSRYNQDTTLPVLSRSELNKTNFTDSHKTVSTFQYFSTKKIKEKIFSHSDQFNPSNLQIISSKRLKYDHNVITIKNKIIDYVHGTCNEIFLLEKSFFGYQIRILRESNNYVISYSNFINPSKILNSDNEIFVLDSGDKSRILVFSKIDRHISYDFKWNSKILDMTIQDNKIFFLTEQQNKIQLFYFENNAAQEIIVDDSFDGANFISNGIVDNKLYFLFDMTHMAILTDSKLIKFDLPKIQGDISDFSVSNSSLILISSKTSNSLNVYFMKISNNIVNIVEEYSWHVIGAKIVSNNEIYINEQESLNNTISSFKPISNYLPDASFVFSPIDSGIHNMKWHRIRASLSIPTKTSIELSTYATNDESTPEPSDFKSKILNPHDALIEEEGRFLWLKFALHSFDITRSPKINDFTIYFPRTSLLRYLPQIYQTSENKDFLERFLALFEIYTEKIDDLMKHFTSYLWPDSTPKEYLPWLATILGLESNYNLPENALRQLLKKFPSLNQNRGTKIGMLGWLNFYFDVYNDKSKKNDAVKLFWIFENHELNTLRDLYKPDAYMQNLTLEYLKLFGNNHSFFHVFVNSQSLDNNKKSILKQIIHDQKPAFAQAQIHFLENQIILGHHTYLGINTFVSKPEFALGTSLLGIDTILYQNGDLHNNA